MGEKILHDDILSHLLEKTIRLQYDNIQKSRVEKRQLKKDNDELKTKNEKLKMKITKWEINQKKEESEEEEDPEERIVYPSSEELSYEEWEAKELKRLKEEEHRDPHLPLVLRGSRGARRPPPYICIIYVHAFVLSYHVGMIVPLPICFLNL
jgi:hypothetical protein